ncbi:MAG: TolC family protein [Cytophagales bacterium]|nr:TolC family protein [Cytophagales bacterium]
MTLTSIATLSRSKVILCLFTLQLSHAAWATPDAPARMLSIDDIVEVVLKNNANLRVAKNSIDLASASIKTAGAIPNPQIESITGNNRALISGAVGGTVSALALSQRIENPSLRRARIDGAKYGFDASVQAFAITNNELIAQTKAKAYEYLLRKEEERAAYDSLALLEQIRAKVKIRVESGEAARYEIIKADAEVIQARQKYQTASLLVEQNALALNRLTAGQLPKKWLLRENLTDPTETPSLIDILNMAQVHNPELKMLQAEVNKRQARLNESKQGRWPSVEIRLTQMRDPEIRSNALSASIQVPLFDQRTGPIAEAVADLNRATAQLEGRRIDLEQQIDLAYKSLAIAKIRVSALSTGAVTEAQAALRVAEAAYRFGERGILDVLDAQRILRAVNADLLDARYQYQLANIELQLLAGLNSSQSTTTP